MSKQRFEYKGISRRAQLLLARSEGLDVEFKRSIKAIDAADLVAFANSESGGAVLIGVEEVTDSEGHQKGKPVGCDIGDGPKLQILNKAMNCVPPVSIRLVVENTGGVPFYRIEVPSGKLKPYCTSGGTYKIREDGRVSALLPDRLLDVFLRKEAAEFRSRFEEATEGLTEMLTETQEAAQQIEDRIKHKLQEISEDLGWAESSAADAVSGIKDMESVARRISVATSETTMITSETAKRVEALLAHLEVPDPIKEEAKTKFAKYVEDQLREKPELLKALDEGKGLSITHLALRVLTEEEANTIVTEVYRSLKSKAG
jgi:ATP-dependent DNA helicase RecG